MKRIFVIIALLVLGLSLGVTSASAQTSFRFVAWGDSRGSTGANQAVLSSLSTQVNGLSPRPAFTLFDGDLCNSWGSACTVNGSGGWKYALNNGSPGNGMYDITFPFRGNHDDSASGWDTTFNGHAQATVTAIGGTHFSYYSSDGANRTFSFDYGNSHFVGIDMPGGDISSMASGQISWLDSDITAAEGRGVTHTFVLDHGPIWPINEHSSSPSSSLVTVMNKHTSISATFHGHEHVLGYAHVDSSRIGGVTHPWEEFVSGSSGAPAYSCTSGVSEYCTSTNGFMTVDVNGNTFTVNLYFQGQGVPAETWSFTKSTPAVTITPTSASFGNQTVGTTSTAKAFTLKNGTASSVTISSIAITGTNSADFAQTKTCGSSLAANAQCTINVTFKPTATGSRTASVTVTDSATGSPHSAALSGTGVTASATVAPTSLTFSSQTVSTTSSAKTATLTNSGTVSLTITSIGSTGDFAETNNCGSSVAAGGSCSISVTFRPTAAGTRTGTVTINDSASNSPQTISLSGTGAAATTTASLSPTSLTFASQTVGGTSAAQAVTLRNTGTGALTITSIATATPFAQTNNCGASLAASASCTINVTFRPTATGTFNGSLSVADNAAGSPQAISLSGTGTSTGGSGLDYYVATTGSDSASGSAASPWKTIAYASTKVGAGAIVHVAPGTYTGPEMNTRASGTAAAPITYVSDTKWGAKLVSTSGSTWSNYGNYVTIQGFDVTGPGYNGLYTEGDHTRYFGNNVHNVLTNRCDSNGGSGINLNGTNAEVNGNYVHNNGPATPCGYVHGIYFLVAGGSAYNNIVFGNAGWGIQLWHNPSHINIVNNTLFGNQTGGIVVGNDETSADYCLVNNNIVYANGRGVNEEGTTGTHNVYQNNLVYANSAGNWSLQNGNTATGTVSAYPLFVNNTWDKTGDYHLTAPSPCANGGTTNGAPTSDYDGVRRPYGPTPDIGALEYTGTSSSAVTLSPVSLTYAGQTVGTTSAAKTLTLKNGTTSSLTISSVAVTGTNSSDYALTNGCGSTLVAAGSCTISVTFKPTAVGTRTAAVTVTDNATGSPQTASLSGTGTTLTSASAPTFVQVRNNIVTTTAAQTSLSVNITTQPGSLLVAFCRGSSSTDNFTVTDSAGQTWTQTSSGYKNESSTGPRLGMFYKANSAAVTSVRVNYTTSGGVTKPGIIVYEISGAATSNVADGSVNNATASVTTSTSGSLTTTNANDILIFATDTAGDEKGWTAGAGYTIPNNGLTTGASGSNIRMAMQFKVVNSAQANTTTTMTYGSTNWNGNIFAAFK